MTSAEKKEFKEWVQQKLQEEEIKIFQFDPATIDEMSRQAEVAMGPPWAVMATKDTTIEDGEVKALRIYDWGAADAANPQHSDLLALQELILGGGGAWERLKEASAEKYEAWRDKEIIREQEEAAAAAAATAASSSAKPLHKKAAKHVKHVLALFPSVPPICVVLGALALLFAMAVAPAALQTAPPTQTTNTSTHAAFEAQLQEAQALLKSAEDRAAVELGTRLRIEDQAAKQREAAKTAVEQREAAKTEIKQLKKMLESAKYADVNAIKKKVREWHANSKAWWLEPLPEEVRKQH